MYAHCLRHTCTTQSFYAGCQVTNIQKFLGNKRLNTTLTYARAHDQTVEEDYFRAMSSVEKRLELFDQPEEKEEPVSADERGHIMASTEKLTEPKLSAEARLVIAAQIRLVLMGEAVTSTDPMSTISVNPQSVLEHAPQDFASMIAE